MGIFKAYDIRGIYGTELTQDDFYKIARAYAQFCGFTGKGKVVVARDCRKSSDALFAAFSQGLVDEGVDVVDIGLASTPMSYFANAKLGADGSVMITASHNTKEWNGCKLCKANAVPISGATGIKDIEKLVAGMDGNEPPAGRGDITKVDISADYAAHVRAFAHMKRPLHLALDFANGMGIAESAAFKDSDITYDSLYGEYDGDFPNHDANPLHHETLKDLQALMKANPGKYAFGVAYDGDADRAGFLDEKGEIIPMDFVTALISQDLLALLRPPLVEGLRGDDCGGGRQAHDVARRTFVHQGADAPERRDLRGRAFGPLLLQGELDGRVVVDGDLRAREHRLGGRQAALRTRRAAPQVRPVGRDQHQDDDAPGGDPREGQGDLLGEGARLRARRRLGRRVGRRGLVGERPHVQHRAARPAQPRRQDKRNHGGQAR